MFNLWALLLDPSITGCSQTPTLKLYPPPVLFTLRHVFLFIVVILASEGTMAWMVPDISQVFGLGERIGWRDNNNDVKVLVTKFLSLSQMQAEGCCDIPHRCRAFREDPQSLDNAMITSGQGSPADPHTKFCLSLHKVCSFPLWVLRNSSLWVQMAIKSIFFPREFQVA